ncbi:MAG: cyclic nucleotide-binding protein [Myxococcales bacterium]|nr:cyclic nucleotide-binding protein [Myxococcales bacterium]|tara:strand:+ start:157 stop:630 length:474 start_codon:yes stop_codon:yes gene_type:complete
MSDEFDRVEALQSSPLFASSGSPRAKLLPMEVQYLADLANRRDLKAGDILFRQGDPGDAMFVVVSGELEVVLQDEDTERVVATLTAPQFLGEMTLIDKQPRSASVRASTDAVLLALSYDNIYSFARAHRMGFTCLVINIAKTVSTRLRDMNVALLES